MMIVAPQLGESIPDGNGCSGHWEHRDLIGSRKMCSMNPNRSIWVFRQASLGIEIRVTGQRAP